jgi:hypothetical protein
LPMGSRGRNDPVAVRWTGCVLGDRVAEEWVAIMEWRWAFSWRVPLGLLGVPIVGPLGGVAVV